MILRLFAEARDRKPASVPGAVIARTNGEVGVAGQIGKDLKQFFGLRLTIEANRRCLRGAEGCDGGSQRHRPG